MYNRYNTQLVHFSICRQRFPYYNIEADADRKIVFKSGEDSYSVEELVAQYIQKARDFAEESTGNGLLNEIFVRMTYD